MRLQYPRQEVSVSSSVGFLKTRVKFENSGSVCQPVLPVSQQMMLRRYTPSCPGLTCDLDSKCSKMCLWHFWFWNMQSWVWIVQQLVASGGPLLTQAAAWMYGVPKCMRAGEPAVGWVVSVFHIRSHWILAGSTSIHHVARIIGTMVPNFKIVVKFEGISSIHLLIYW